MCAVLCDKLKKTENNNKLFDEMIPWINVVHLLTKSNFCFICMTI